MLSEAETQIHLGGGYNYDSTALRQLLDSSSTALRPFDDLRHVQAVAPSPGQHDRG